MGALLDQNQPISWRKITGLAAGCAVLLALGYGSLIETGLFPSSRVITGRELPGNHLARLLESQVLQPNEEVLYFYSSGMVSITEDGNILTDRRVIAYESYGGSMKLNQAALDDIVDVAIVEAGGSNLDTVIEIQTIDGAAFRLTLSTLNGGDTHFIKEIMDRLNSRPIDTIVEAPAPT